MKRNNECVLISYVGVDTKTDLDRLIREFNAINSTRMFEFGVLYSAGRAGKQNRYPSYADCLRIKEKIWNEESPEQRFLNVSVHLCGDEAIEGFLDCDPKIIDLCRDARVQLNFKMDNYKDSDRLYERIAKVQRIRNVYHEENVILQMNKSKSLFMNSTVLAHTEARQLFDILYDGSGGFGRVLSNPSPPIPYHFTGYAGGISPDTVTGIVEAIEKVNPGLAPYYIDMESGVRTNDLFDIDKCLEVANIVDNLMVEIDEAGTSLP